MPSIAEIDNAAEIQFVTLSLQYYALGRAGALSQLMPVTGNLLHHAVEMALKGLLVRDLHLGGLKQLGHNLDSLWRTAVARHPDLDSERRRGAVGELHRFESLRYPDQVIVEGAAVRLSIFAPAPDRGSLPVPLYDLVLEDVDELFQAIFKATGLDPDFFLSVYSERASAPLTERNRWPLLGSAETT